MLETFTDGINLDNRELCFIFAGFSTVKMDDAAVIKIDYIPVKNFYLRQMGKNKLFNKIQIQDMPWGSMCII